MRFESARLLRVLEERRSIELDVQQLSRYYESDVSVERLATFNRFLSIVDCSIPSHPPPPQVSCQI